MNVVTLDGLNEYLMVVGRITANIDTRRTYLRVAEYEAQPLFDPENMMKPIKDSVTTHDFNLQRCWTPSSGKFYGLEINCLEDIILLNESYGFEYICELYPYETW